MAYILILGFFVLFGNVADVELGPGVVEPVECVGIACDAEHDNGLVGGEFVRPDVPDEPDDDDDSDDDDKPGWGHGDRNHDHSGPPGQNK